MALKDIEKLECTINDNYSFIDGLSCNSSSYKKWLVNGQSWWLKSAVPEYADYVW